MLGGKMGIAEALVFLVLYAIFCGGLLVICLAVWLIFSKKPFPWKKFILVFAGLFVAAMTLSFFGC